MIRSATNQDRVAIEYGLAVLVFIAVSFLNLLLKRWIGYQAIALVYLLAVVLLALFVGRGPILLGAALTSLGWSFLFAPPSYSFRIGSFYDKMMFAMYFVVALTVAQLTARLREERMIERKREADSRALYMFTRELADARDHNDIIQRVLAQVGSVFKAEVAVLFPPLSEQSLPGARGSWALSEQERKMAELSITQNQPVGLDTSISSQAKSVYLPLSAGAGAIGVLAIRQLRPEVWDGNQLGLLENFARQTALVLDRQRLRDAEIKTRLLAESERFGRTLLNSVSHELRTPLAAIATAADTLRDSGTLTPLQSGLSSEIDAAIFRLNRVVQSLLSAARIQSGQLRPKLDWCDLADVVRAVLRELGPVLDTHQIERNIQSGLPLVRGDFVLLHQALANLLVNAVTYTPRGTSIEIHAEVVKSEAVLRVADYGPGLPENELDRIFDVFHRPPTAKPGGTGLGLAIVKGFMEAQGGHVQVINRPGAGAQFSLFLPLCEVPQLTEEFS